MTLKTQQQIIEQIKWARSQWYDCYDRDDQNYMIDLIWDLEHNDGQLELLDYTQVDRLLNRTEYYQQHHDFVRGACPMDRIASSSIASPLLQNLLKQCGENHAGI
jgi:hypothetical protein